MERQRQTHRQVYKIWPRLLLFGWEYICPSTRSTRPVSKPRMSPRQDPQHSLILSHKLVPLLASRFTQCACRVELYCNSHNPYLVYKISHHNTCQVCTTCHAQILHIPHHHLHFCHYSLAFTAVGVTSCIDTFIVDFSLQWCTTYGPWGRGYH